MLSSFAYGLFFQSLLSQGYRKGIPIHQVNPAFTSVIGQVNYATRYGLSIHLTAAFCIARRYQQFSESPNLSTGKIPDGKGCHVAFDLPVRNRTKHVWHSGASEKENNGACSTFLGEKTSILGSTKFDPCDRNSRRIIGVTPIRESLAKLPG